MKPCTPKRLLAALGLILSPIALRAAEAPRPSGDWRAQITGAWSEWNGRFGLWQSEPVLKVSFVPAVKLPGLRGRYGAGQIEINESLAPALKAQALRHELAHAYLERRCAAVTAQGPFLSEAFALFTTGEAAAASLAAGPFLYATAARDHLAHKTLQENAHDPRTQAALNRLLGLAEQREAWERYFGRLLAECGAPEFSLSKAGEGLWAGLRGKSLPTVPTSVDFLLVDAYSFESLARQGKPDEKRPTGSLLKPTFFGLVPEMMNPAVSQDNPYWDCPEKRIPGQSWTWQKALLKSCNGFFLSHVLPPKAWEKWDKAMSVLGLGPPLRSMEERIGLNPKWELNLPEVARIYGWLSRTNPFVIDVLRKTAGEGTLAGLSDSSWFRSRQIALKTGTVSDVRGVVRHSWIAAVGPGYIAVVRGQGMSTHALLGELKTRLRASLPSTPRPLSVQILGLVPSQSVALGCGSEVPLLERDISGGYSLFPAGTVRGAADLKIGYEYSCAGGAIRFRLPTFQRDYWGTVRVTEPLAMENSDSYPKEARAARARQGSRFVLQTSERHYVVDTLLSEFPRGHTDLLKALALVIRHNARVPRHGPRPLCDTTHCQVFGQGGEAPLSIRRKVEAVVDATANQKLTAKPDQWLPFFLGGMGPWTAKRNEGQVQEGLRIRDRIRQILKTDDETLELVSQSGKIKLPCETLRNQLKLMSCPDSITASKQGWVFKGRGEGHGMGLDLTLGNVRAGAGETSSEILARFYPSVTVRRD